MTTPTRGSADGGQDVLEALGKALSLAPSPDFLARVRAQVCEAATSAPAAAAWWPRPAVLGAAAVAIVVAVAMWPGRTSPPPGSARVVTNRATGRITAPRVQTRPRSDERALALTPIAPSARPMRPHRTLGSTSTRVGATEEPPREVLVPDDQRRALDRLLIAIREGRVAVPAARRVLEDEQGQMLQPAPIDIPLMKPIELLPGAAVERTGSKDR